MKRRGGGQEGGGESPLSCSHGKYLFPSCFLDPKFSSPVDIHCSFLIFSEMPKYF